MPKRSKKKSAKKKASQTLGLREYARARGVSHTAVSKAIAAGRIRSAEKVGGKWQIDATAANREWEHNTNPVKKRQSKKSKALETSTVETDAVIPSANGKVNLGVSMQRSAAVKLACQAQLARLQLDEKTGTLVEKGGVETGAFQIGRALRDRFLSMPSRMSAILAAESSARTIHTLLEDEVIQSLELLVNGK